MIEVKSDDYIHLDLTNYSAWGPVEIRVDLWTKWGSWTEDRDYGMTMIWTCAEENEANNDCPGWNADLNFDSRPFGWIAIPYAREVSIPLSLETFMVTSNGPSFIPKFFLTIIPN